MSDPEASHQSADSGLTLKAAGRVAGWCAQHAVVVVVVWLILLALACVSLSRLTVSASLPAMLGNSAHAAAATQRITTGFQSGDDLLVVAEATDLPAGQSGTPGEKGEERARRELVAFAERFTSSVASDPGSKGLVAFIRTGSQREFVKYAREVVLPNGALFLSDEQFEAALKKLQPDEIRAQIIRNEAMVSGAGPAAGALSNQVLRDPLRLFEIAGLEGGAGSGGGGLGGAGQFASAGASGPVPSPGEVQPPELSADGKALLLRVASVESAANLDVARRLTELAAKHVALTNTDNLRVRLGGPAPIATTAAGVIRGDAIWATVVSVSLLAVLFGIFYRRWSAALLIGGVTFTGMIAGVGALGWFLGEVSPLGAMVAALLAGLGTDYGIHFLSHYDGARAQGHSSAKAVTLTATRMAVPIATNCLTSVFGFASLWISDIKMLSDFASLGAAGLFGALVAVLVLMPAVMVLVDGKRPPRASGIDRFGRVVDGIARWPRSCMTICAVALLATIVAAAGRGFVLRLEPDLSVMHPQPNPALDATRFVMERFTGRGELVPVEVVASTPEGLVAAVHNAARAIGTAQPRIPGLVSVAGLHQLVPDPAVVPRRLARIAAFDSAGALDAFDKALDDSVFEPSAYAGYRRFLVSVLGAAKVPTVSDVMDYPEVAQRLFARDTANALPGAPLRTILLVTMDKPLADREQRAAAIGALVAAAERQPGVTVAGLAAVSEELQAAVQTGLPISVAVSVGLVLIWLLIVFRRPMDVLLALIPLVFAGGATVMFMIASKQNFNPINSVAIPLLNGIAVDAGVFLVAAAREYGSTRENLVRHLRFTTHAVILAAATTLTAFASLCFGHTPAIGSLGMVASVGITASFFGAMLVLMPIMILRAKPANPANPANLSNPSNPSNPLNPSNPSAASAESTVASV